MTKLEAALDYAKKGWFVLPVKKDTVNKPLIKWNAGPHQASKDSADIENWWANYPDANVAIMTGRVSNLLVLDVDKESGGLDSIRKLMSEGVFIGTTAKTSTPGGGFHLFYKFPAKGDIGPMVGIMPGLDVRANDSYVLAAPSERNDKKYKHGEYIFWDAPLLDCPDWLLNLMGEKGRINLEHKLYKEEAEVIKVGSRDNYLTSYAGYLQTKGYEDPEIVELLLSKNNQFENPLPEKQVIAKVNSIIKYPKGGSTPLGAPEPVYDISALAADTIKEVARRQDKDYKNPYRTSWLKYNRLGHFEPGSLIILGGKSGMGKSRFALNLTQNWLQRELRVLYVSYEMTAQAVMLGLGLIHSNLPWDKALAQKDRVLTGEEFTKLKASINSIKCKPLFVDEFAENISQIDALIAEHQIDVFIIDTVNELIVSGENFWVKLGELASGYKKLAKRYGCLALMLAQLGNYDERPTNKEMLAESKRMKNSADYMDFLYRSKESNPYNYPEELERVMEVYRVKGRFTGTGRTWLDFNESTGRISELSDERFAIVQKYLARKINKGR